MLSRGYCSKQSFVIIGFRMIVKSELDEKEDRDAQDIIACMSNEYGGADGNKMHIEETLKKEIQKPTGKNMTGIL